MISGQTELGSEWEELQKCFTSELCLFHGRGGGGGVRGHKVMASG